MEDDPRILARNLYWQGYKAAEIARTLDVPYGTVDGWKRRDKWDETPIVVRIESHIEARILRLIGKVEKTDRDLNELDHLSRVLERTARIRKYDETGKDSDIAPRIANRNKGRKKDEKNALTEEQVQALLDKWKKTFSNIRRNGAGRASGIGCETS